MSIWEFLGGIGVAVVNGMNERKMHKLKREEAKEAEDA